MWCLIEELRFLSAEESALFGLDRFRNRRKMKLKCTQWATITMIVVNTTCIVHRNLGKLHIPKCNFILFGKDRGRGSNLRSYDLVWCVMRSISRSLGLCRVQMNTFYLQPCQLLADCYSKNYSSFNVRFLLQRIIWEPDDRLESLNAFGQLELCASESNCEYLPILFPISSLSNVMTCKHPREEATDMAANINNSSIHLLAKYESPIVRQLDMLLKWRVKSQKLFLMAQWLLFIGG